MPPWSRSRIWSGDPSSNRTWPGQSQGTTAAAAAVPVQASRPSLGQRGTLCGVPFKRKLDRWQPARLAPASRGVLSGDGWLSIVPSTALGGGGVAWSLGSSGESLGFPCTLPSPQYSSQGISSVLQPCFCLEIPPLLAMLLFLVLVFIFLYVLNSKCLSFSDNETIRVVCKAQ